MKRNLTVTPLITSLIPVVLAISSGRWTRRTRSDDVASNTTSDNDVGTIFRMAESVASPRSRADHWNAVHEGTDEKSRSWYQSQPAMTFQFLDGLAVPSNASVIDVGGGASSFVDQLLARNSTGVTVLDVSRPAARTTVPVCQRVGTVRKNSLRSLVLRSN
jgi:secreted PhoX family phosphatase